MKFLLLRLLIKSNENNDISILILYINYPYFL